jgi:protein-tyrosine-phosphatase
MFAAVLQHEFAKSGKNILVQSAGYLPEAADGRPAAQEWALMSNETGIDLNGHRSRRIDTVGDLRHFDVIICMNESALTTVYGLGVERDRAILVNPGSGGIPDPYRGGQQAYRDCYRAVVTAVHDLIDSICPK